LPADAQQGSRAALHVRPNQADLGTTAAAARHTASPASDLLSSTAQCCSPASVLPQRSQNGLPPALLRSQRTRPLQPTGLQQLVSARLIRRPCLQDLRCWLRAAAAPRQKLKGCSEAWFLQTQAQEAPQLSTLPRYATWACKRPSSRNATCVTRGLVTWGENLLKAPTARNPQPFSCLGYIVHP